MPCKYLAVWSYILDIHLEFHGYFALNSSLYFTLISVSLYKMIAKSHLDFRCTEHWKLTQGFLGRDWNSTVLEATQWDLIVIYSI